MEKIQLLREASFLLQQISQLIQEKKLENAGESIHYYKHYLLPKLKSTSK